MAAKIELTTLSEAKSDALGLGWFQEESSSKSRVQPSLAYIGRRNKDIDALVQLLKQSKHFAAKKNEADLLRFYSLTHFPNTALLGLGPWKRFSPEIARQAGAALYHLQKKERLAKVTLEGESVFGRVVRENLPYFLQAFCEGYWLASYEFKSLKKEEEAAFSPQELGIVGLSGGELNAAIQRAKVLSTAVNFARSLGDKPGNHLTPSMLANEVSGMARKAKLRCVVWGRAALEKQKMGLLLGVAQGSEEEPRFIILEHKGGKRSDKPIVLVGKGITFDAGGISIKPAAKMEDMKYDMMGAATVAAVCQAVAELDLPVNVIGLIAAAENLPSGKAQKPGDIATSRNGKTVEVINTDAEGRLILADALEYAQELDPAAIIDFATLTGAVVDALGNVTSGIMGNHRGLLDRIKMASDLTAERVWELPLYDEYGEDLKSTFADIKNIGVRGAGSSKGGAFLKFFVDSKFPWVHCDIAGTAWGRSDVNYHSSKHASGAMIRLVAHLLEQWNSGPLEA